MLPNFKDLFPELPDDSRVWIYSSNREMSPEESEIISENLIAFVATWATHGASLTARSTVVLNRFLIIAADENRLAASGCSIDSSVRFIKQLGQKFNIDLFDRLKVYVLRDGLISRIPYHELKKDSDIYFDPLTDNLKDLRNNWPLIFN